MKYVVYSVLLLLTLVLQTASPRSGPFRLKPDDAPVQPDFSP